MNIIKVVGSNIPNRHFCSHCETKTTSLHLLLTSSKVRSTMQSTVTLVMDQSLVEVLICAFIGVRGGGAGGAAAPPILKEIIIFGQFLLKYSGNLWG